MESLKNVLDVLCPEHAQPIKSVVTNNLNPKNVLCPDCYNVQNEVSRIPVEEYVERCAKAQSEYTSLVNNVKKKLPKALKGVLDLETEAVKQLREYFNGQKGHIDYLFDKLQSDLRNVLKVEKEKLLQQLEEQVKNLERNFTYYNLKLAKYDTSDPPEPVSIEKARKEVLSALDKIKNGLKFQEWVKDTNEDIEDLVIYNKFKSDENKMKGIARCLKFLSQQLEGQTKIRPVLSFNESSLAKIRESIEEVFKSSAGFDNPIHDLAISSYFFESDLFSSPKDFEFIRTLVDDEGKSAHTIYRIFTSTKKYSTIQNLVASLARFPKTLIIFRTYNENIIGAYTDQSWAKITNPNYIPHKFDYNKAASYKQSAQTEPQFIDGYKTSQKSVIFDLNEKHVLKVLPEKTQSAIWVPAVDNHCIQFGGRPDLMLLNNGTSGFKVSIKPGHTYYPVEKEQASTILTEFAGGEKNRIDAVITYLEAFAILDPEQSVSSSVWRD